MKNKVSLSIFFIITILMLATSVPKIFNYYDKIEKLKKENKILKDKIEILEKNITTLKNIEVDKEKEKIARNKLKMIKENEHIYKLKQVSKED